MNARRISVGFGCGALGTVAMSIPMMLATGAGVAPMPRPIPAAIVASLLGPGLPKPLLMLLAVGSHLLFGGVWGAALTVMSKRVTVRKGVALGVGLWLGMQLIVLPALGWGVFGAAVTPKIALATLILHLIYGVTTGYFVQRFVR